MLRRYGKSRRSVSRSSSVGSRSPRGRQDDSPPPIAQPAPLVPREFSDQIASWLSLGQPANTVKELRGAFLPVFEDQSFLLSVPKLDDTVERQLSSSKNSKYIMQRENVFKSMQYQVLDFVKPLLLLMGMFSADTTQPAFQLLESTIRLF